MICFGVRAGRPIEMDRPVTNWSCLPPPPKLISAVINRAAVESHGQSRNIKRPPMVDCGMVDLFGRDRRSN
jgi:hypothetical protein